MPKVLWFLLEVLLLGGMAHLQHFKFLENYLRVWVVLVVEDVMVSHLLLLVQVETVIADLVAVKNKQHPPLAHKDFGAGDLHAIAAAEAAVEVQDIPVSQAGRDSGRHSWMVIGLGVALAVSVIGNIVLLLRN